MLYFILFVAYSVSLVWYGKCASEMFLRWLSSEYLIPAADLTNITVFLASVFVWVTFLRHGLLCDYSGMKFSLCFGSAAFKMWFKCYLSSSQYTGPLASHFASDKEYISLMLTAYKQLLLTTSLLAWEICVMHLHKARLDKMRWAVSLTIPKQKLQRKGADFKHALSAFNILGFLFMLPCSRIWGPRNTAAR